MLCLLYHEITCSTLQGCKKYKYSVICCYGCWIVVDILENIWVVDMWYTLYMIKTILFKILQVYFYFIWFCHVIFIVTCIFKVIKLYVFHTCFKQLLLYRYKKPWKQFPANYTITFRNIKALSLVLFLPYIYKYISAWVSLVLK